MHVTTVFTVVCHAWPSCSKPLVAHSLQPPTRAIMTSKEDRKEALKVLAPTVASGEVSASDRDNVQCKVPKKLCFTVVVLGASGDLAKKKTFPALFLLYSRGYAVDCVCVACSVPKA